MGGHSKGDVKGQFCALRSTACGHGNYKTVCKPSWDGSSGPRYNAHHLLCVADVTGIVLGATEQNVDQIVRQTNWCINKKPNMYAMPLWGHTFKHYLKKQGKQLVRRSVGAPGFANIPQHNSDHAAYQTHDVQPKLVKLVNQLKKAQQPHTVDKKKIADQLNSMSKKLQSSLKSRGKRAGGTHNAWIKGGSNPKWYLAFSMADAGKATKRTYPKTAGGDIASKALSFLGKK